jgi:hypothetical protein
MEEIVENYGKDIPAEKKEQEEQEEQEEYNPEDADESEQSDGSDSKYHNRNFSDVSDLVEDKLSTPDFCTANFAVIVLLILFNLYFLFFGTLFVDALRGDL